MQQSSVDSGDYSGASAGRRLMGAWRSVCEVALAIDRTLARWHYRSNYRKELARLDRHVLQDVGLDPIEVNREANKPFWKN